MTLATENGAAAGGAPWVVLDTNVVLDWLVFRDTRVATLDAALQAGALRWLGCAHMLRELDLVLARAPLNVRPLDRAVLDLAIRHHLTLVDAPPALPVRPGLRCSDRDDQIFIELALQHRAALLLSRDRAVLKLRRKAALHGLCIDTPERALGMQGIPDTAAPAVDPASVDAPASRELRA
ncbi:MAG: hypothetical protein RIQ60_1071 [Pseudomonadota bacterium]|jgi:predicted nucleic acid-binding protein